MKNNFEEQWKYISKEEHDFFTKQGFTIVHVDSNYWAELVDNNGLPAENMFAAQIIAQRNGFTFNDDGYIINYTRKYYPVNYIVGIDPYERDIKIPLVKDEVGQYNFEKLEKIDKFKQIAKNLGLEVVEENGKYFVRDAKANVFKLLNENPPKCANYERDNVTQEEIDIERFVDYSKKKTEEMVNNPAHYGGKDNPFEAIKVIEAWNCNFNIGNAVKYLSRAGKKDKTEQDLQKAIWYINREIENLKKKENDN